MDKVVVNRDELLNTLKKNREEHAADYAEAVTGYQKVAIKKMRKHLKLAKTGEVIQCLNLIVPQDHTSDYDRAIKMLEMSVDTEIVLTEHDFKQLVLDDWQWKAQTLQASAFYKGAL